MAETIKIAVCDDEKNIRSYLVSLIKKQGGECSITEYASADAYLSDGKEHDIIPASNEPSGRACTASWRMPRGSNTLLLAAGYLI